MKQLRTFAKASPGHTITTEHYLNLSQALQCCNVDGASKFDIPRCTPKTSEMFNQFLLRLSSLLQNPVSYCVKTKEFCNLERKHYFVIVLFADVYEVIIRRDKNENLSSVYLLSAAPFIG